MKLLAIDSSGLTASVAVISDGIILSEYSVNNKKTHSQTLLPMINEAVEQSGVELESIDAVAVAQGPGSFTGLRIGASTVKGLCLALKIPVVPVSTLAGLAGNLLGCGMTVCPIMDARRNQVYTAVYSVSNNELEELCAPEAVGIDEVLKQVSEYKRVIFTGDGVNVHEDHIRDVLGDKAFFALPHMRLQRAASIAVIAASNYSNGLWVSATEFKPVYLRLSQAERERLEAVELS